jgi:hypothetical protein
MKNKLIIPIILLLLTIVGCKNSNKNPEDEENHEEVNTITDDLIYQLFNGNCSISFDEFFDLISKDSVFQKNSIKYPLKYFHSEYSYDLKKDTVIVDYIIDKNEISFIDFSEDKYAMEKEYDKYQVFIDSFKNKVEYKLRGYDNGLRITYFFDYIQNCWYLTTILDEST